MKTLIIGIDGGDRRIIDALEMPALQQLFKEHVCLDVEEDLWSRGWTEILSGVHGRETGAFYNKPKLDGSYAFTQSFGSESYPENSPAVPLWKKLNDQGHRIGFMNVPTTMPAPAVKEGFMVAGAGGGVGGGGNVGAPAKALYPKDIDGNLLQFDYILDTRFVKSGRRDAESLFALLEAMQQRRTEAFLNLCSHFEPHVGFVAFMATTRVQYLGYQEVAELMKQNGEPRSDFQRKTAELYRALDDQIARLLDTLQPEHVMVVSDHGAAPRRYTINANVFLQQTGLQKQRSGALRFAKQMAKKILPSGSGASVRSALPSSVDKATRTNFAPARTQAFAMRYVPGVYVNDRRRFGGPVGEAEVERVAQDVIEAFNASPVARQHDLHARAYRAEHADAHRADLLPDVWIDHPDEYFFEARGGFVEPNADYGPLGDSLAHVTRDQFTGAKGRHPLLCVDEATAALARDGDPADLTLAYQLIDRLMAA